MPLRLFLAGEKEVSQNLSGVFFFENYSLHRGREGACAVGLEIARGSRRLRGIQGDCEGQNRNPVKMDLRAMFEKAQSGAPSKLKKRKTPVRPIHFPARASVSTPSVQAPCAGRTVTVLRERGDVARKRRRARVREARRKNGDGGEEKDIGESVFSGNSDAEDEMYRTGQLVDEYEEGDGFLVGEAPSNIKWDTEALRVDKERRKKANMRKKATRRRREKRLLRKLERRMNRTLSDSSCSSLGSGGLESEESEESEVHASWAPTELAGAETVAGIPATAFTVPAPPPPSSRVYQTYRNLVAQRGGLCSFVSVLGFAFKLQIPPPPKMDGSEMVSVITTGMQREVALQRKYMAQILRGIRKHVVPPHKNLSGALTARENRANQLQEDVDRLGTDVHRLTQEVKTLKAEKLREEALREERMQEEALREERLQERNRSVDSQKKEEEKGPKNKTRQTPEHEIRSILHSIVAAVEEAH